MKAEITKGPLGYAVAVRDEDGYLERELLLCEDSALALQAALTEWKAKREAAKPVEPKLRPFRSMAEVPPNAFAVTRKQTAQRVAGRRIINFVCNVGFDVTETRDRGQCYNVPLIFADVVDEQLILADGSIVPCGILE